MSRPEDLLAFGQIMSTSELILRQPGAYILFQRLVGADRVRLRCIDMLGPRAGDRVLDVGCGPAYYLPRLPDVDYHGFDTEPRYIEYAQRRFANRQAKFHCELFTPAHVDRLGQFDGIFLLGLLHHLSDEESDELLRLGASALKPGGTIITADPCYYPGQTAFDHFMISRDRGQYVRPMERFLQLARKRFDGLETELLNDVTRIPYTHIAMRLTRPKAS